MRIFKSWLTCSGALYLLYSRNNLTVCKVCRFAQVANFVVRSCNTNTEKDGSLVSIGYIVQYKFTLILSFMIKLVFLPTCLSLKLKAKVLAMILAIVLSYLNSMYVFYVMYSDILSGGFSIQPS